MGRDSSFPIKVLREKGIVYEGRVDALFAPGMLEPLAILPWHTPMIAKLAAGEIIIKTGKSHRVLAEIETGLIWIGENEATVLLDL